ncbi:hypothetical protein [Kamptonema formosum]|uniref:hypothetical protein n=1 Tax=Kamptonema formosum TaxID=331992 RepID=UPI00034A3F46|nr:hypothetical protein [Oscillatoria sp. PCC 10802]
MRQFSTPQAANTPDSGWQGSLNLIYANRTGTSQLVGERVGVPLKVERPAALLTPPAYRCYQ